MVNWGKHRQRQRAGEYVRQASYLDFSQTSRYPLEQGFYVLVREWPQQVGGQETGDMVVVGIEMMR